MMLLVEGPDMVGKTKFCDAVMEYAAKAYPNRPLARDKFGLAESDDMVNACDKRMKPLVVCDRCWISEVVYGVALRGQPRITPAECLSITRKFNAVGGMLVVVWANGETYAELTRRHWARGEAFTESQCALVASVYENAVVRGWAHALAAVERARGETAREDWILPWIHRVQTFQVGMSSNGSDLWHPGNELAFVARTVDTYMSRNGVYRNG